MPYNVSPLVRKRRSYLEQYLDVQLAVILLDEEARIREFTFFSFLLSTYFLQAYRDQMFGTNLKE
jgi:hypothetical protein